ncbi:heterokaryon incompatibility protein-domain-containing protein [Lasiosphaeria hispida]|uniref:Heterokaryon incompatibility protein-domain-containing protein n=1 Tax=Lasiosphaeria hispida TaxID=260671 RepID=A0AAJ0H8C5_9PEZI|nr:heterokaryon incompatibility protein-domain-containing protein [Lasiosphaeria hispida]
MNMNRDAPIYLKPLDPAKKEIRLLELLPLPENDGATSCRLSTVSLLNKPKFTALSYHWGSVSDTEEIMLNGVPWHVTKNLAAALSYMTQLQAGGELDRNSRVWVDALCINQASIGEKKQQVFFMHETFEAADCVFSWLGSSPTIALAFELLRVWGLEEGIVRHRGFRFFTPGSLDWVPNYPEMMTPNDHWTSLREFFDLDYWKRIWIFQEIVVSRCGKLIFYAPGARMSASELKRLLELPKWVVQASEDNLYRKKLPPLPGATPAETRDYINSMLVEDRAHETVHRLLEARQWCTFLHSTAVCLKYAYGRETQATDPRDFYYSSLGISGLAMVPRYEPENSPGDVCIDFVRAHLDATRDFPRKVESRALRGMGSRFFDVPLLFLQRAVGPKGIVEFGLPSWAPDYHLPTAARARGLVSEMPRLVGTEKNEDVFESLDDSVKRTPELRGDILSVFGIKITTVSFVGGPAFGGEDGGRDERIASYLVDFVRRHGPFYLADVPAAVAVLIAVEASWLFMSNWSHRQYRHDYHIVTKKLLTLVPAIDTTDQQLQHDIEQAFLDGIPEGVPELRREYVRLEAMSGQECCKAYPDQNVKASGKTDTCGLFETLQGHLGWATLEAQIGDLVCMLDRFDTPVILRRFQDSNEYMFVGQCAVMGLMSGEAKAILEGGDTTPEVFRLR